MKPTALALFSSAFLMSVTGCKAVSDFYEQDTGELQPVPGPPPAAVVEPAPADAEVQFSEPAANGPASVEADPIEPMAQPEPMPVPTPVRTYTIKKGDNYWKIAKEVYGDPMKMVDIEKANPDVDPKKLQIGDEIVLPE